MSDAVQIALIVGLAQVIPALLTTYVAWKMKGLHHQMNSMHDALIASAKVEGHAQGVKDEKANPTK